MVVLIIDLILSDEFLIKDNHIASSNIKSLVSLAIKNKKGRKITVEVDNLKQLNEIWVLNLILFYLIICLVKNLKAGMLRLLKNITKLKLQEILI